jgi:hypothetical protein
MTAKQQFEQFLQTQMTAKQQFEQFLQTHMIHYHIPNDIRDDDSIFESIHAVCEKLVTAEPSLLNARNLKNLETLMRVAKDAIFFTGIYNAQYMSRPFYFRNAINMLSVQNPSVLYQDTFDGLCDITTANLDQTDIYIVAECFVDMAKSSLLTQKNTQALVKNVINAPLQVMYAPLRVRYAQRTMAHTADGTTESIAGPTLSERSRAQKLKDWLSAHPCPWLRQDHFDLVMRSKLDVDTVSLYMQKLHEKGLNTSANCQALVDTALREPNTQKEFNATTLRTCDAKLIELKAIINGLNDSDRRNVVPLYNKLSDIIDAAETLADPRDFLNTITVINNALPTQYNQPTKAHIDELIALGHVAKKHPSPAWQAVGRAMILLGAAIAIAAGIALTVGTVGIATPVGMAIAAAGAAGAVSVLTGFGFFAYVVIKPAYLRRI